MGRVGAPHEPAVVVGITGFEADQAAGVGANVNATAGHRGLEDHRLADGDAPEFLAVRRGEAMHHALEGPEKELAVDDRGRCQGTVQQLFTLSWCRADRFLPVDVIRPWVGGVDRMSPWAAKSRPLETNGLEP